MVISMTGFATKIISLTDKDGTQTQLTLSLRSLNSRFFETTCKLPFALQHLETEFIKMFQKQLHRGNILFLVQVSNPNVFKSPARADLGMVNSYLESINTIQERCKVPGSITINDLVALPNVFSAEEQTIRDEQKNVICNAVQELIDQLVQTRIAEGHALEKDLMQRVTLMQEDINQIEKIAETLLADKKKQVSQRIAELDQSSPEFIETQRHILYLELDKMDIHEEIVRFKSHLATFKKNIESTEQEKGRRLDFILQELARETNTIAAKCGDSMISSLAINIKVELEKAREQVQNIV
jgi:uncharacterized protein (TIGR00255 family)